jgi:Holliday junction resolvase RusA-like endonuclease
MMIEFVISGMPIPKARPRVFNNRTITPKTTVDYEKKVRKAALNRGVKPLPGPVGIELLFEFPVPSATRKRDIDGLIGQYATNVKDIDNLAKAILDGLNGIAYLDDRQVAFLFVEKKWAIYPRAVVKIAPIKAEGTLI